MSGLIRIVVTVALGGIGAAAGFTHTHDWAAHHGQTGWLAWADAIVIEGLVVVAGFEVHRDHHRGDRRTVTFPLLVLVVGFGVQMAAQVALAERSVPGWLLAAMPALGFLIVVKLLMRRTPEPVPLPPAAPESHEPVSRPAPDDTTTAQTTSVASRVKLPPAMVVKADAAVREAQAEGRDATPEDIRRAVRVPDPLAQRLLDALSADNRPQ
ncbi:DUF2637 domain-containing protein [Amycolatopsis minnesotensis]|uniref:DUF2637 domain-containing protein n=1 Tax=Amycolatopsis minnesotensis TaxID=337894 RepID=UPI0031D3CCA4